MDDKGKVRQEAQTDTTAIISSDALLSASVHAAYEVSKPAQMLLAYGPKGAVLIALRDRALARRVIRDS